MSGTGFEAVVPNPKLKLMDQVREVMRLRHYSFRTERSYCDWIRRFVKFHHMQSRADLDPAEFKIEAFLSDLAISGRVAVSTQNQAFNGLRFLYQQVLHQKRRRHYLEEATINKARCPGSTKPPV